MNRYSLREKIEKSLKILNEGLVGKEKVMKLGLLSILSGENMILVGPPGTAKSEISRRLREIIADCDDGAYFEYLFTKFTTPEEIFGPLSIKKLQNDKFERNTEGYMPSGRIVFLDEIFKANSSILNTLLTILNERVFHNGLKREKTPLISLIGASNELPFENDELTALYDRFLIRAVVGYVSDDEIEMLLDVKEINMEILEEIKFTESDLDEIKNESEKIKITSGIKKTIIQIERAVADEGFGTGVRRIDVEPDRDVIFFSYGFEGEADTLLDGIVAGAFAVGRVELGIVSAAVVDVCVFKQFAFTTDRKSVV